MNYGELYQHRKEMADWIISQKPQLFFTGTYREEPSAYSAYRNSRNFFEKFRPRPTFAFLSTESKGVRPHVHGVLRFDTLLADEAAGYVFGEWLERYGRCKVEKVLSAIDVAEYTAKYITKEQTDYYAVIY